MRWQRAYPDLLYYSFSEYCIIKVVQGQTPVCCQAMLQGTEKITLKCFCTRASISETTEETITHSVSNLMTQKHKEYMPQQRTSKGYTIVLQRSWQHQVSPFIFVKQMFFYHVISCGKEARGNPQSVLFWEIFTCLEAGIPVFVKGNKPSLVKKTYARVGTASHFRN